MTPYQMKRTLGRRELDGERLGLHLTLRKVIQHAVHPRAVAADVRRELHVAANYRHSLENTAECKSMRTKVIGANLERLVATHEDASLLRLLVLQKLEVASAALLPLVGRAVKAVQLGAAV